MTLSNKLLIPERHSPKRRRFPSELRSGSSKEVKNKKIEIVLKDKIDHVPEIEFFKPTNHKSMTRFIPSKNLKIKVLDKKSFDLNNDYYEGKKEKQKSATVKKTDLNTIVANFLKHQDKSSRV